MRHQRTGALVMGAVLTLGFATSATGAAVIGADPAPTAPTAVARVVTPASPPTRAVAIAAGNWHTLLVGANGRVYGTGRNFDHQLTYAPSITRSLLPLRGLPTGVKATGVAAGTDHTLVMADDGALYGAGSSWAHQLAGLIGERDRLVRLGGLPDGVRPVRVAAGSATLVLGTDRVLYGVGPNAYGQLTGVDQQVPSLTPLGGLPTGVRVRTFDTGQTHTLVVGSDGRAYGTGENSSGQLTGTGSPRALLTGLLGLPAGVRAVRTAAGGQHSLVLGSDGRVYGAGANGQGQLTGKPGPVRQLRPLTGLPRGVQGVALAAGGRFSLVLGSDRRVYGTGQNAHGELTGPAEVQRTLKPLALPSGVAARAISAGKQHTLVLGNDGIVYGVGDNQIGQLAGERLGQRTLRPLNAWGLGVQRAPTITPAVAQVGSVLQATPGIWSPSPGSVTYQWFERNNPIAGATGSRYRIQPWNRFDDLTVQVTASKPGYRIRSQRSAPMRVIAPFTGPQITGVGRDGATVIASDGWIYRRQMSERSTLRPFMKPPTGAAMSSAQGYGFTLMVGDDGQVYGRGTNAEGQLTGDKDSYASVHRLTGLPEGVRAESVSAGESFTVVLADDGVVYGAGRNTRGQLGGSTSNLRSLTPIAGLPVDVRAADIASGRNFTLVLGDDGIAYGVGANIDGQLTGDAPVRRTLTALEGLPEGTSVTAIAAEVDASYVTTTSGDVFAAGGNDVGELGGSQDRIRTLTAVPGLPPGVSAVSVAAEAGSTHVVGDDGVLYSAGWRPYWDPSVTPLCTDRLTPVTQPYGGRPIAVSGSIYRVLVLTDNGTLADPVLPLHWGLSNVARPTFTGTPRAGQTLTAEPGDWWPSPSQYQFSWRRDGGVITGATSATYRVTARDVGHDLSVWVMATAPGLRAASAQSEEMKIN